MSLVMRISDTSTCSASTQDRRRQARDVQANPDVIEAYLGSDTSEAR
jgi:ABC-type branched-subunit amino acid transport system ATPase component